MIDEQRTKLQYKFEQLQKLYEDERATELLSAEKTGSWVEKTRAELDLEQLWLESALESPKCSSDGYFAWVWRRKVWTW